MCPECEASLKKAHDAGSTWNMCAVIDCSNQSNGYTRLYCYCLGPFSGYPYVQNGVCMSWGTVIPIVQEQCYCCCSCFGIGAQIAISKDNVKSAYDFNINDMVLVATDVSLKKWVQKPVLFSAGTGKNIENRLISIHFDDPSTKIYVASNMFVAESVTQQDADNYYNILSTKPNNYIGKDGIVDKGMIRNTNPRVIAKILTVENEVANRIYAILSTDSNYLLVTRSQPFLMKDGTLKQAEKLIPGRDILVRQDGSTLPIISLELGLFEKGVHHIATSAEIATSLDGHLLLANGIVIGDYSTQISMASKEGAIKDNYKNDPALGTEAYNNTNIHLTTSPTSAHTKTE